MTVFAAIKRSSYNLSEEQRTHPVFDLSLTRSPRPLSAPALSVGLVKTINLYGSTLNLVQAVGVRGVLVPLQANITTITRPPLGFESNCEFKNNLQRLVFAVCLPVK